MMGRSSDVSKRHQTRHNKIGKTLRRAVKGGLMVFLTGTFAALAGTPANLQQALQAQRALVADSPRDGNLLNDLGNLLALAGDLQQAEETYRRALDIDPNDVTALYNLALVLMEQGETKQAHKCLRSILELDPRHAWTHYQLGTLFAEQGNRSKAVRHYSEAFAADRSLTSPKINPHIVENTLATDALLMNYRDESPSTQAPRIYEDPGDVADLLLPRESAQPTPETAPEANNEPVRQPRASTSSPPAAEVPASSEAMSEGQDPPTSPSPVGDSSESESQQTSPRRIDDSTIRARQAGQTRSGGDLGQDLGSTTVGTTPSRGTQSDPSPTGGVAGAPPSSLVPPAEGTSASPGDAAEPPRGFTPGTNSTGRLEIELLPANEGAPVVRTT